MKTKRVTFSGVLLILAPLLPGAASAQAPEGEYRFWVFATAEATDTVAAGRFVLGPPGWDLSAIPDSLVRRARRGDGGAPVACFRFDHSRDRVAGREFYGGIVEAGLSPWTASGDTIEVGVYRSPDASQALRGRLVGGRISGTVLQRDADARRPVEWLPFEAVRVGPATDSACRSALEVGRSGINR